VIYLDNASGSHPKPESIYQESDRALRSLAGFPGMDSHAPARAGATLLAAARREAAELFGLGRPERVVFTAGGTDALTMALKGLLRDGDHVVTTNLARAAISRSLDHMQMAGRIALTRVDAGDDGRIDPATLVRAVAHRTRLVILSHGCEVLGTVQPVEEVARMLSGHKALLLVDASHTAGLVPLHMDSWGVDLVATSGHRGLYGPPGVGLLLVGGDVRLRPLREGESGGDPSLSTQPLDLPWSLEAGVPNMPGIVGLLAGMRFVNQQTLARLREHDTTLIKRFIGAVGLDERFRLYAARGDMPRTGTVSFTLRGFTPQQVAQVLEQVHDIQVAAGLHAGSRVHVMLKTAPGGTVRVSVGWFNTEDEIDRTVAALREMADAGVKQALSRAGA